MIQVKIIVTGSRASGAREEQHLYRDSFMSKGNDLTHADEFFRKLVANAALLKNGVTK